MIQSKDIELGGAIRIPTKIGRIRNNTFINLELIYDKKTNFIH